MMAALALIILIAAFVWALIQTAKMSVHGDDVVTNRFRYGRRLMQMTRDGRLSWHPYPKSSINGYSAKHNGIHFWYDVNLGIIYASDRPYPYVNFYDDGFMVVPFGFKGLMPTRKKDPQTTELKNRVEELLS